MKKLVFPIVMLELNSFGLGCLLVMSIVSASKGTSLGALGVLAYVLTGGLIGFIITDIKETCKDKEYLRFTVFMMVGAMLLGGLVILHIMSYISRIAFSGWGYAGYVVAVSIIALTIVAFNESLKGDKDDI